MMESKLEHATDIVTEARADQPIDHQWFRRIETLFHELADLPAAERTRAIEERTVEDAAARRRLKLMFAEGADVATTPLAASIVARSTVPGALAGATLGHYRLAEFRGEGGFGEVYVAEQLEPIRRRVAVKVLRQEIASSVSRFEREVETLALMEHPAIARIFDAGTAPLLARVDEADQPLGERCYIAMEVVDGLPLLEFAIARGLTCAARLDLFARVLDGVVHAHQKGVIHRDLKPANVLIAEVDGRAVPKIIDFGIARAVDEASRLIALSAASDAAGTPRYMSPEQANVATAHAVDSRSDIYSLGVMLKELLSSRGVEGGAERQAEAATIVHPRTTPRWMRADLDAIVARATATLPDHRYGAATELAADLRHVLAAEPISVRAASSAYRARRWLRRHRVRAFVGAVLLAGGMLGLAGVVRGAVLAREEAGRADRINEFLREVLTSVRAERRGASVEFATVIDDATRLASERFAEYPLAEADVREVLAEVNANLGRRADATAQAERVEAIRRAQLGPDHPETIEAGLALGRAYLQSAATDKLDALATTLSERIRARHGEDDPRLVQTGVLQAKVIAARGGEADALDRIRSLRDRAIVEGSVSPETMSFLLREEIGLLRRLSVRSAPDLQGRAIDGQELYDRSRQLWEAESAARGADSMEAWVAQLLWAKACIDLGRLREGRAMAEELLRRSEQRLSETHKLRLDANALIARHDLVIGELHAARVGFERMVERHIQVGDPKELNRIAVEVELPRYLAADGDFARAEETSRAIAERLESYGGNFARMAYAPLMERARALSKLGRHDEATALFDRLLADAEQWEWYTDIARLTCYHAGHLAAIGAHDRARAAIERSLEVLPDPRRGMFDVTPGDRLPIFAEVAELAGSVAQAEAYRAMREEILREIRSR
jgi:tetratricopeptide (TPR) repeat protein